MEQTFCWHNVGLKKLSLDGKFPLSVMLHIEESNVPSDEVLSPRAGRLIEF